MFFDGFLFSWSVEKHWAQEPITPVEHDFSDLNDLLNSFQTVKPGSVYFVTCPKQGLDIEAVVLHRVGFLAYFCPKQAGFQTLGTLYPNMGQVPPVHQFPFKLLHFCFRMWLWFQIWTKSLADRRIWRELGGFAYPYLVFSSLNIQWLRSGLEP